jgi:hypothetical protein
VGVTGERDDARSSSKPPSHPGQPARVSLLIFPARGRVARLLEPRDASAVLGSIESGIRTRRLRRVRGSGWRRNSDMLGDSSRPRILPHLASRFYPGTLAAAMSREYDCGSYGRHAADTVPVGRAVRDHGDGP